MSVALNVIIVLGIVIAGSFLLFFLGDFFVSNKTQNTNKEEVENKDIKEDNRSVSYNSSVFVTDYIQEEAKQEQSVQTQEQTELKPATIEEPVKEQTQDDEEKRIAEARAALERRKAEILKRMQAQIEEEDEEEEEAAAEEQPVQEKTEEVKEEIGGIINTDETIAEEEEAEEEEKVDTQALQAEIEMLKNQLGEEKAKYDALSKELEEKANVEPIVITEQAETLGSKEDYEAMLEDKLATLKVVEKEFKQCKKDFIPLYKVHKTLEKDEKKLHRREAVVAKQKVVLYGVNNYADIDEEKAKKLAEDLDLLDGLKLSVNHCKEVMEQNKDRYPILERLYNSLKSQVSILKAEIEKLRTIITKFDDEQGSPVEE